MTARRKSPSIKTKIRSTDSRSIHNSIPAIYQTNFLDTILWAWVTSAAKAGISHTEAFETFRSHFRLDEDTAPSEQFNVKYWRVNQRFIEATRHMGTIFPHFPRESHHSQELAEVRLRFESEISALKQIVQDLKK